MPDWTKRNLHEVEDRSPDDLPMRWLMARGALRSPEIGISLFTYEPGARMPFAHRHREQQEVYVVVGGAGRAHLDGEIVDLERWDAVRVAPSVVRSFEAGPDGLEVLCVGGRRPTGRDTERFDDPWA